MRETASLFASGPRSRNPSWRFMGSRAYKYDSWLVVKIMVPFLVPIIIRHLLFRVPKKEP